MTVYEMRTYTLHVGKMAEAVKLYTEFGYPALHPFHQHTSPPIRRRIAQGSKEGASWPRVVRAGVETQRRFERKSERRNSPSLR